MSSLDENTVMLLMKGKIASEEFLARNKKTSVQPYELKNNANN